MKTGLEKKLFRELKLAGIGVESRVVVAVSGGADSSALLEAMVRARHYHGLPGAIVAAHLNHGLRGAESDGDELFVRALAARLGVELVVERADAGLLRGARRGNLEAAARAVRYDFLRRAARESGAGTVVTAHTLDDQTETVLMRLLRGSGADGLRGIRRLTDLGEGVRLLRPLLGVSRSEVLEHCDAHTVDFRTDSSNLSPDLTRNRVRLRILPLMREINPRFDQALGRAAAQLAEEGDFIDSVAERLLAACADGPSLRVAGLLEAHPALRHRAIRLWLARARGGLARIERSHIEALDALAARGRSGRKVELPGGAAVRQLDSIVYLAAAPAPSPSSLSPGSTAAFGDFTFTLLSPGAGTEPAPGSDFFARIRVDNATQPLTLRARKPGDAYVPAGKTHKIKLKTLMIRHKIPVSLRDTYPVLVDADDRIVWSPGLPTAADFSPGAGEEAALVVARRAAA